MEDMKEVSGEIDELNKQLDLFELDHVDPSTYTELKNDISENFQTWSLVANFEKSFEPFLQGEWAVMKSRVHEVQQLAETWKENELAPSGGTLTLMQTRLRSRLDGYVSAIPLLKWCRGDNFTTDHWIDLFRLIGVPKVT